MDLEALRQSLAAAVVQVLEETAFVLAAPAPDFGVAPASSTSVVLAQLAFEGPVAGRFSLVAPPDLCAVLAADMTGESDAGGDSDAVLGEILNMVAGITLERTLSGTGQWDLGVPEVARVTRAEQTGGPRPDAWIRLLTEEQEPIEAAVSLAGRDRR